MAILAGWILFMIGLVVLYIVLMPEFVKIGTRIHNYFYRNVTYKEEMEDNDPVKSKYDDDRNRY